MTLVELSWWAVDCKVFEGLVNVSFYPKTQRSQLDIAKREKLHLYVKGERRKQGRCAYCRSVLGKKAIIK